MQFIYNVLVVDRGEVDVKLEEEIYEVEAVLDYAKEKDNVRSVLDHSVSALRKQN